MKTFIFLWLLSSGAIVPAGDNEGRPLYTIQATPRAIEHAYQGEILEMFRTGKFEYDEDLPDITCRNIAENQITVK